MDSLYYFLVELYARLWKTLLLHVTLQLLYCMHFSCRDWFEASVFEAKASGLWGQRKKICSRHKYFTSIRCQHFFITKLSQQQWSQYINCPLICSIPYQHKISVPDYQCSSGGMWSWPTILTNDQTQKSKHKNVFLYYKLSALTSRNMVIYISWCSTVWNKTIS